MDFNYLFLAVGDDQFLEDLKAQVSKDFPRSETHTTSSLEDGRDFCQANVYDLILAQTSVQDSSVEPMIEGIREMNNDNKDTGALLIGEVRDAIQNLKFIMFAKDLQEYLVPAKTLLSLKR